MTIKTLLNGAVRIIALMALGLACITLTTSPVAAQGFMVAFGNPEFTVSPGDRVNGTIPVTNISDEPATLKIYMGDWVRVPEQTSEYNFIDEGGSEPRSFVDWMTFSPDQMTLEPEETRDVTYEVNVPDDPTLEGSYWGVIYIEGIPTLEPDIEPVDEQEMKIGILTVWRYAIQIYITIEGTEIREATFSAMSLEQAEGGFDAVAVFDNTGNIFMRPEVWLEITDTTGEVVYEQEHGEQTVLPESARDFVFKLRYLPIESGEYMVMIYADYGVPTLIAAQGRVNYIYVLPPEPEEEEPVTNGEEAATVEGETGEPEEPPVVEEPEESE